MWPYVFFFVFQNVQDYSKLCLVFLQQSMRQGGANNTAGKIILFDMVNHEQDAVELAIEGAGDFKLVRPQSVSVSPASSGPCLFLLLSYNLPTTVGVHRHGQGRDTSQEMKIGKYTVICPTKLPFVW